MGRGRGRWRPGRVPGWLREAVEVDRGGFVPLRGLRCAVGVVVPLAVGVGVGQPAAGVLAAAGALNVGVVSLTQGARTPLGTMVLAGTASALSTFVGSVTGTSTALVLLVLALWGAGAGLLVAAGPAATVVGVQAVVGLLVTGRFPRPLHSALAAGGEVLLGGACQLLLAVVLRPPARDVPVRRSLAAAADVVAAWARSPGDTGGTAATRAALGAAQPLVQAAEGRPGARHATLRSMLDGLVRVRLEVSALVTLRARAGHESAAGVDSVLAAAAADLGGLADALRRGRDVAGDSARDGGADGSGDAAVARAVREGEPDPILRAHAAALGGQLRALQGALEAWGNARSGARDLLRPPRPRPTLTGLRTVAGAVLHPGSQAVRHATRLAVVLPAAEVLARILPLQRGYWVALTALVVLKPDFAATVSRGVGRIAGTLAGVVPATLVVAALHPRGALLVALVGLGSWFAYASFPAGFALFSSALASLVVVLLDVVDPRPFSAASARALDTLLGGALALLAYRLWPSWEGAGLAETLARLVEAQDRYAAAVLSAYRAGPSRDLLRVQATAGPLRQARTAAEASVARVRGEPASHRPELAAVAGGLLAAGSRLVRSLHLLDAQLQAGRRDVPAVDTGGFPPALHALLAEVAVALRDGRAVAASNKGLRMAAAPLLSPTGRSDEPGHQRHVLALLAREVDEIVDAVDTMAHLLEDVPVESDTPGRLTADLRRLPDVLSLPDVRRLPDLLSRPRAVRRRFAAGRR